MIEHLKPISGKHSISKVLATIFIPQEVIKPKDLFDKLILDEDLKKYQKKNLTDLKTINLNYDPNQSVISNKSEFQKVKGFIFEEFNREGRLENILKLENINEKKSAITFENRIYEDWDIFYPRLKKDLEIISNYLDFYVDAINLTYVDEFLWDSEEEIKVYSIFNENSELINKKFLNSENGSIILFSQGQKGGDGFEERTEIAFGNRLKRIVVNHQNAIRISELDLFTTHIEKNLLDTRFEELHDSNKNVLKDLFTKDTQNLIDLK